MNFDVTPYLQNSIWNSRQISTLLVQKLNAFKLIKLQAFYKKVYEF